MFILARNTQLTSITVFEALQGLYQSLNNEKISEADFEQYKNRIDYLIGVHKILDFNGKAADIAAYICSKLGKSKSDKLWYDILIVATVLAHGFGLASGNQKDMKLIAANLPKEYTNLPLAIWRP